MDLLLLDLLCEVPSAVGIWTVKLCCNKILQFLTVEEALAVAVLGLINVGLAIVIVCTAVD